MRIYLKKLDGPPLSDQIRRLFTLLKFQPIALAQATCWESKKQGHDILILNSERHTRKTLGEIVTPAESQSQGCEVIERELVQKRSPASLYSDYLTVIVRPH